jgi:hypothetical protein
MILRMRVAVPVLMGVAALLRGQNIPPTRPGIRGLFPHGAERGTEVEITIRGRNLQGASEISFATPKLKAQILQVQHNLVRARVHVDATAEPGRHDLRLIAPQGSTIAWFDVGTRHESFEKEPNNDIAHAQPVTFPILLNGVIQAGDYDYFKFEARAGQTLTFDIAAERFESSLDSVLSLLDEKGVELAYIDDYYWFKDPHLVYTFARAGTYYLRVFGTSESGSESSDYRLTAGEMPQVDYVMPTGGERGKTAEFTLSGVNLKTIDGAVLGEGLATAEVIERGDRTAKLRLKIPADAPLGLQQLHVGNATLPVAFVISDLPQIAVTTETARRKDDPVPVTLPVVANGTIDTGHAGHYFTFRIDQPQKVLLAVDSQRMNFDLDAIVVVYDESGKRIAYQDDPAINSGKRPANLDPHLAVDLKAGRYTVLVRDNAFRGGAAFAYRLVMKRAEPDFTAGTVGTDETLFRGKEMKVIVRVRRLEGWNTPVEVWAENLPAGVTGPAKVTVPPAPTHYKGTCGEDIVLDGTEVEFPLTVASDAPGGLSQIRFRARGVMDGRIVEHAVQANYSWSSTQKIWGPAETSPLYATVTDAPKLVMDVPDRVPAPRGKPGTVKVVVTRLDGGDAPLELRAVQVPAGLVLAPVTVQAGATLADVPFTASAEAPVTIVLEGVAAGRVLGRSHPIVLDTTAKGAAPKVVTDEN